MLNSAGPRVTVALTHSVQVQITHPHKLPQFWPKSTRNLRLIVGTLWREIDYVFLGRALRSVGLSLNRLHSSLQQWIRRRRQSSALRHSASGSCSSRPCTAPRVSQRRLARVYGFEFTVTGEQRHVGMLGQHLFHSKAQPSDALVAAAQSSHWCYSQGRGHSA